MTPDKVLSAYRAIKEISGLAFPYKTARSVAKLKRRLQEEAEIVENANRALVEKYGGKLKGNKVRFEDPEQFEKFQAEYNDFMGQDADIKLPTVDLSKHTSVMRLSPDTIEALDGIVLFEKEDD